jgi:glutathione S-transferase
MLHQACFTRQAGPHVLPRSLPQIPYQVIEVNPLTKAELKWSDYKKVPVIKMDGEVLKDSNVIISRLAAEVEAAAPPQEQPRSKRSSWWVPGWPPWLVLHASCSSTAVLLCWACCAVAALHFVTGCSKLAVAAVAQQQQEQAAACAACLSLHPLALLGLATHWSTVQPSALHGYSTIWLAANTAATQL